MGMPVRRFGATGWELTTVGLGTWALGGGDWAFGWAGLQLTDDDLDTIAAAIARSDAGSGPSRPEGRSESDRGIGDRGRLVTGTRAQRGTYPTTGSTTLCNGLSRSHRSRLSVNTVIMSSSNPT
jgi:hypothetical protein